MIRHFIVVSFFLTAYLNAYSQNVVLKTPAEIALLKVKELLEDKKYEEAVKKLEEVLVTDPDNAEVNYYLGSAYQALDQDEKASGFFLKSNELMQTEIKNYSYGTLETL